MSSDATEGTNQSPFIVPATTRRASEPSTPISTAPLCPSLSLFL